MSPPPFATHEVTNQSPPFEDVNLFTTDAPLREAVAREGAGWANEELDGLGAATGSARGFEIGRLAEQNPPKLRRFDPQGRSADRVEYHPAFHEAMAMSCAAGLHCSPWEHLRDRSGPLPGAQVARLAGLYMMTQMEPGHVCPITMTHASVPTLLRQPELAQAYSPGILSRSYDPSFRPAAEKTGLTLGMGMTEKQGGTDVRANTTTAQPVNGSGGEYRLVGHKWFMSAPMSDAFLMLAQAPAGLSCFLVPRLLPDGTVNPIRLQRLKDKLGNRSNASAEVELHGVHGWLVGEEGRGLQTIIEMVTLTRLDCAMASAGQMRRALALALHHCRHRTVFQRRLVDQPLMAQVLADMALDVEAATALAFRLARAFDQAEKADEAAWRRLMTPVTKYWVCKIAPALGYEAMECLGGNGYVEDGPMARLYRELPLNAIWEGSGNVMCLDALRVVERDGQAVRRVLDRLGAAGDDRTIAEALRRIEALLRDRATLETNARIFVETLARTAAAVLLRQHAPEKVADAFIASRLGDNPRQTYGSGVGHGDAQALLERALPG